MTQGGVKIRAPKQVTAWKANQPVSAAHLNRMVEQGNELARGVDPARQVRPQPKAGGAPASVFSARLRIVYDDTLLVDPYNPDTGDFDASLAMYVAKPWDLQRTPWDGQAWGGIQYTFITSNRRRAQGAGVDQEEVIIPRYLPGVVLRCGSTNRTGIDHPDSGDPITVEDTNAGGRAWAVVA